MYNEDELTNEKDCNCGHDHEHCDCDHDHCDCGHDHSGYGPDYMVLQDEDGQEYELEVLGRIELDGKEYMAFCDADIPQDSDEAIEVTIFRVETNEDGTEDFLPVDDEEELERVYQVLLEEVGNDEDDE